MKLQIVHPSLCLVVAILALAGCAATAPVQQQELRDLAPNEGMVVGSVWIKGGRDVLGRTRYGLVMNKAGKISITPDHTVEAQREGDEVVFAAVMLAGDYRTSELRQLGFSNFVRFTNFGFQVEPGKITYIGRLLVEFPQETITMFTPVRFTVEDAMDATLRAANTKYGKDFGGASVRLMTIASMGRSDLPGKTTADARLEDDTLFTIMGMDRVEDAQCKQRTLANREIVRADSKGALEHWTINRCGTLIRYRITYSPGPGGGTLTGYTPPEVIGKAP